MLMLFLSLLFGYLLRLRGWKSINEAAVATLIGIILGAGLKSFEADSVGPVMRLNVEVFLLLILPPIIFESGFSLNKALFFKELGGVLTFAFLGTTISATVTGVLLYFAGFLPYVKVAHN